MIWARTATALLALGTLGGLIVTLKVVPNVVDPRFVTLARVLLVPLGLTMLGLVAGHVWSRWFALAAAVAVLPWAAVLTFGLPGEAPVARPAIALVASLVLLRSLSGREIAARYERRASMAWDGWRMRLVQWTIILNLASVLGLLLFVVLYRSAVEWHMAIPATLLGGLAVGLLLLGLRRTIGLLLVGISCVLFAPAGAYFVWQEASYAGEAYLFAACFLPGVVAGWVCLLSFSRPIWLTLRAG